MEFAGLDIGSRHIKLVVVDETGEIVEKRKSSTSFDPMEKCAGILAGIQYHALMATGYGRHLFSQHNGAGDEKTVSVVSEIKAHAKGAKTWFPDVPAILDIGGQDTKVISLGASGKVKKFEMNDRCAAGTGKFLEVMAVAFNQDIEEFGNFAMKGDHPCPISSMCTVFAESEATSLMARGEKPQNIALGLHLSVAKRAVSMVKRVAGSGPLVFSGGVANNRCIQALIQKEINEAVVLPEHPQYTGAFGAALLAME